MIQTPEDKAKDLFVKFSEKITYFDELEGKMEYSDLSKAKQYALIAVDEIIKATTPLTSTYFWKEVKEEINNL
jgi:hypothetical protein